MPRAPRTTARPLTALITAALGSALALAGCTPIDTTADGAGSPAASTAPGAASPGAATAPAGTPASTAAAPGPTAGEATAQTRAAASCTPAGPPAGTLADGPRTAVAADEAIHPISTDPRPTLPATVRSDDGRKVTVKSADRIVAADLYGTLGEIVFSLGLGDHLVGRDVSTGFAEAKDVPVVTRAGHQLDVEGILDLDPDVVLVDDSILTDTTRSQLEKSGVPVVLLAPERTLASVGPRIEAVATALGLPADGEALAERTDAEICAARAAVPARTGDPVVAFLYLRGTGIKMLFGPGSGADELITAVGARDAGTEIGLTQEYRPVTSEALIDAAPDAYLVMTDGLASAGGLGAMLRIPGLAHTPAGEARRVVDMDGSELLTFGPRTAVTIRALTEALYGDAR